MKMEMEIEMKMKMKTPRYDMLRHREDSCIRSNCAKIWHKGAIDRFPNPVLHPRHVVPLHQVMILGTNQFDMIAFESQHWTRHCWKIFPVPFHVAVGEEEQQQQRLALQQQLQQQQQLGKIAKTLEDPTYTRRVGVKVKQ